MAGRMGTSADVLFGPGAMAAILEAAEKTKCGGLSGKVETDAKGEYRLVAGTGRTDVGMFFSTEGTEPDDAMTSKVREALGKGVMVVIDPEIGELAVYLVDQEGRRMASALLSE